MQLLRLGEKASILPCTPQAILHICDQYGIQVKGKKVLVIGRSNLVGLPISILMLKRDATVTICHKHSQ
jgi:methylenetetrahydrofolate dehydrogenase (NADP+)/methenyltetrahydrofolate cyclohydrolase